MPRTDNHYRFAVALFCILAFLGAAWTSVSVFERLPHTEDEVALLFQAQTIASGRIVAVAPEPRGSFSMPFIIVREGMWFGKYPPGFPLLLAAGVLLGQPWLTNALLAAGCVALIFQLGRQLYGPATALYAAGLLAVSPLLILQAGSLLSHVASLFWSLLALLAFSNATQRPGLIYPLVAGGAMGMLLLTRPLTAAGVVLPLAVWALVVIVRQRRIDRNWLVMGASLIPFVGAYLAYNAYTTGSPFQTGYQLWWPFDHLGFGPDVGINGHDLADARRNTRTNANAMASWLFGWPARSSLLLPAAAAIVAAFRLVAGLARRRSPSRVDCWDLLLAAIVLSIAGVHVFYWTTGQMYGPRYFMEMLGPLALLSARAIDHLRTVFFDLLMPLVRKERELSILSHAAIVGVLVWLTAYSWIIWTPGQYDQFRGWNGIQSDGLAYVESFELTNAVVVVERRSWVDFAPFFSRNRPSLDTEVVYAADNGRFALVRLLEIYPDRAFYLLIDGQLITLVRED